MKLKTKNDPQAFVDSHGYIEQLGIHYQGKLSFFTSAEEQMVQLKGGALDHSELIAGISQKKRVSAGKDISAENGVEGERDESQVNTALPSDGYFFALKRDGGIIYTVEKGEITFIFECAKETSAARIKMETETFIAGFQVQGKYRKFFSSIFDW